MRAVIHIIVKVDTDSADIYDHEATCNKIRDLLEDYVDIGRLKDQYIGYLDNDRSHDFIKAIDRIEVL